MVLIVLSFAFRHLGPPRRKETAMERRTTHGVLAGLSIVFGMAPASLGSSPADRAPSKTVQLDEATMIVEVNATDGDAGLQVFLDGEPWRSMSLSGPDGERIVAINTRTRLRNYGLTELFSESSEPSFKKFPLRRFKKLFPEGRYSFAGTTIEGDRLVGKARLSHDIPAGPQITKPADGSTVPAGSVVASWNLAPEPRGINIVGYRAIVERENPLRIFSVELPASKTSVTIPQEFLESGTKYKLEVQAIEASGNQTTEEVEFSVS
jgi:hypothetical protein